MTVYSQFQPLRLVADCIQPRHLPCSVATPPVPTLPRPCWVMGFAHIRSFFEGGGEMGTGGRWRTDSATNLRRKAFDSCKLSVYIWLLGACPQTFTRAPPLHPTGELPSPDPQTSEPGYTTASVAPSVASGPSV